MRIICITLRGVVEPTFKRMIVMNNISTPGFKTSRVLAAYLKAPETVIV
jgi:hypothetical protein